MLLLLVPTSVGWCVEALEENSKWVVGVRVVVVAAVVVLFLWLWLWGSDVWV